MYRVEGIGNMDYFMAFLLGIIGFFTLFLMKKQAERDKIKRELEEINDKNEKHREEINKMSNDLRSDIRKFRELRKRSRSKGRN